MKKAVLFDLDGTMWDASQSVTDSFNIALEQLGLSRRISLAEMQGAMGKTLDEIAHIFFDCVDPDRAVDIMVYCTEFENKYIEEHGGVLYPDLKKTLSELKDSGWFVACVSNCQSGYIEAFIKHHGLSELFDDTECWGDTGKLKADNISLVVSRNNIDMCVYVGDTMGDYNSAMTAGVKFIHSAYGYGSVPDGTPKINSLSELGDKLKNFI